MKKRVWGLMLLCLLCCAIGASAAPDAALPIEATGDGYPLTIRDYLKVETTLESMPKAAAVISGTPLNIWYDLGGKSICCSDISENVKLIPEYREELLALPTVGPVYSVNMEQIIAQQPDFIIAQVGTQGSQATKLRGMGFSVITTYIRTFEDVIATYDAFGKILQQEALAKERIEALTAKSTELNGMAPEEGKSVVILYLTANAVSVKLDNSIAGDIAKGLKVKNIASNLPPDTIGSENTPLDIEYIVQHDPDYVLVASMIADNQTAVETMEKHFATNPAWKGVKAIAEGRVLYLPQEYFLYNAGPYYCEAIEYMARGLYPETYGPLEDWYEQLQQR
ncbi:MAG TPA: ABC transporter substrate-binding protein [Clostridia bacterium]|nr:ABC transporter substrate-binding protein [Clostridia bacterium]